MTHRITNAFHLGQLYKKPVFIGYLTAGFPREADTLECLFGLESGGADIIEIGIPFSDPIADGPTIQESSFVALNENGNGFSIEKCLFLVATARQKGLKVPVVFMGYYNPFLNYGEKKLMADCKDAGVDGFIVVDLPPEEAVKFRDLAEEYGLSYIPLITPSTSIDRIKRLVSIASSFIYVVSVSGVTGARDSVSTDLPNLISRIKQFTTIPLAVGFGVSTRQHFLSVAAHAQGVVIGSKIISVIKNAAPGLRGQACRDFAMHVTGKNSLDPYLDNAAALLGKDGNVVDGLRELGIGEGIGAGIGEGIGAPSHLLESRFGEFGGQYAPEALVDCLDQIEKGYIDAIQDPKFWQEFRSFYPYMNRPSQLHLADRLTEHCGGAKIWLKREDLNHTGAHKINNALGQALLAKRLGKSRIIAETGAGQHGVATATICAKLGLKCIVYMGSEDVRRQALNVFRMKIMGATVVSVSSGSKTLKDAINEAMRDWVSNVATTHYIIGSAIGPHPFPTMVREFQSVIGRETREQMLEKAGKLPDVVVACVGGGSNAIGMFHPFINDPSVKMLGVEAGGDGIDTPHHSATLTMGRPGVLHGTRTYLMQDDNGQIVETHSISAGLDYPGVGPEHAWLKDTKRAEYVVANDTHSLIGFRTMSELEGIIPALETAHGIYAAMQLAKSLDATKDIVICVSGRGDKDVMSVAEALPKLGPKIDWNLRFEGNL